MNIPVSSFDAMRSVREASALVCERNKATARTEYDAFRSPLFCLIDRKNETARHGHGETLFLE
ncbi:hypothetical protein [Rhizobium sp. 'Codium 1']|uniref:hypothetical protein n=1 Tax=Rhizobium sp. 'Codium 1' TaxID=2940484 RepID=UPI001E6252AC|nr:hypothetical protein [Rhizobium sp. 'Codium 1']MCC8934019.1 hypothetical protein [Rhizobium sp. 'Codium 1']